VNPTLKVERRTVCLSPSTELLCGNGSAPVAFVRSTYASDHLRTGPYKSHSRRTLPSRPPLVRQIFQPRDAPLCRYAHPILTVMCGIGRWAPTDLEHPGLWPRKTNLYVYWMAHWSHTATRCTGELLELLEPVQDALTSLNRSILHLRPDF
jgi:hypothetical protein